MRANYTTLKQEQSKLISYLKENVSKEDFNEKMQRLNQVNFSINKMLGEKAKPQEIIRFAKAANHQVIY